MASNIKPIRQYTDFIHGQKVLVSVYPEKVKTELTEEEIISELEKEDV